MEDKNGTPLHIGDYVRSVSEDFPGLMFGEFGTVVGEWIGSPLIEWDEYNQHRHNSDNRVKTGHGWFVSSCNIEVVKANDLGEIVNTDLNDLICDLFGGIL